MAFSGTSITVENITGLPLSVGKAELVFGTWLIQPTDVPNPLEPKTFEVHSAINGALGSMGTVHYTIDTPGKKTTITINFKSSTVPGNFVTATVDNVLYQATINPPVDTILVMAPVIAVVVISPYVPAVV